MIIIKPIDTGLDIEDPISECEGDIDANLLTRLTNKFENKCFDGCFIRKVIKILERSVANIDQNGDNCFGKISIKFLVEAVVYMTDEIINGCVVTNKNKKGIILCEAPHASIVLNSVNVYASIQVGQIISVVTGKSRYNIGSDSISVNAMPFSFPLYNSVYYIKELASDTKEYCNDIIQLINAELKKKEELKEKNPQGYEAFSKMLYPYHITPPKKTDVSEVNIIDLVNGEAPANFPIFIGRDLQIETTKPTVYIYKSRPTAKQGEVDYNVKQVKSSIAFLSMLNDYYNNLRCVREMIEIYDTEEKINKHRNLWMIYKKEKYNLTAA